MRLLTTTALAATLVATGALAASDEAASSETEMTANEAASSETGTTANETYSSTSDDVMSTEEMTSHDGKLIRSRDITGGTIYTMNAASDEGWNMDTTYDEVNSDWNDIGEIEDLVMSSDGKIIGIVAEVGGFLDIADKHVMISVSDLNLVAVDDTSYAYVTKFSEEDLESMKSVDEGFWN